MGDPSDNLVHRIRKGDQQAFSEVYQDYFEQLWQFAYKYVRSEPAAEEVVHDVFLNIWRAREKFEVRTTLRAYLYGAIRNRALTLSGQEQSNQEYEDDDSNTLVDNGPPPDAVLEREELSALIQRSVDSLPERQRLVMSLRLTRELTYLEIAFVLGVSEAAVGKLMLKAQARLKAALGSYFYEEGAGG